MAVPIDICAQRSMDIFYTNYKSNSDFFDLEDFAAHCAGVLGDVYMKEYQVRRAEFRQEKKDEVISFDVATLLPQLLDVEKTDEDGLFAKLKSPVMSFPYDEQGVGVQMVFSSLPKNGVRYERTTVMAQYQLEYVPACGVIFFFLDGDKVRLINKSSVTPKKIRVFTVPSIEDPNLMVPDGVAEYVITTAALTIKQIGQGVIVKKADDQNANKSMQTEANLLPLK